MTKIRLILAVVTVFASLQSNAVIPPEYRKPDTAIISCTEWFDLLSQDKEWMTRFGLQEWRSQVSQPTSFDSVTQTATYKMESSADFIKAYGIKRMFEVKADHTNKIISLNARIEDADTGKQLVSIFNQDAFVFDGTEYKVVISGQSREVSISSTIYSPNKDDYEKWFIEYEDNGKTWKHAAKILDSNKYTKAIYGTPIVVNFSVACYFRNSPLK